MSIHLSKEVRKTVMIMLDNGANNGRISMKFAGITRAQIQIIRDQINAGTEQTKKKLKKDPLLTIYKQKDIEIYELYAADHIRKAYQLITADVKMKSMKFEGYVDVFSGKPTEKEGELLTSIQHKYADWFDECTKRHIKVGPIIHTLTEPVTFKDVDRHFTFRNGRTKLYVIDGLKLYVRMYKPRQGLEF